MTINELNSLENYIVHQLSERLEALKVNLAKVEGQEKGNKITEQNDRNEDQQNWDYGDWGGLDGEEAEAGYWNTE
jgi:hypothetical protein